MVMEMVLESLSLSSTFSGRRLGADAIATVGLTESLLSLVMAIGFASAFPPPPWSLAASAKKIPPVPRCGRSSYRHRLAISALVGIPCFFYGPHLLRLMGASPQVVGVGSGYARIALGGSAAIMMLFLNNAISRRRDAPSPCGCFGFPTSSILSSILASSSVGTIPQAWRYRAALATFTGRSIGVLYQFYRLLRARAHSHLAQPDSSQLHCLASPAACLADCILQFMIAHTSWIGSCASSDLRLAALAGYTIAIRILIFVLMPSWVSATPPPPSLARTLAPSSPSVRKLPSGALAFTT